MSMLSSSPSSEHAIIRDATGPFNPVLLDKPREPISLGFLDRSAQNAFPPGNTEAGLSTAGGRHDMSLDEVIKTGNPVTAGLARATKQFLSAYCPPDMQKPEVYPFVRIGYNHDWSGSEQRVRRHFDGFGDVIVFAASIMGPAIYDPSPYAEEARHLLNAKGEVPDSAHRMGEALNEIMPEDAPIVPVEPWEILVGDKYTFHGTPIVDPAIWRVFGRLSLYFNS